MCQGQKYPERLMPGWTEVARDRQASAAREDVPDEREARPPELTRARLQHSEDADSCRQRALRPWQRGRSRQAGLPGQRRMVGGRPADAEANGAVRAYR